MYTFQALADINTAANHDGFWFMVALVCVAIFLVAMKEDDIDAVRGSMIGAAVVLICSAVISFNTGDTIKYANKQVSGTLVGFQGEVHSVTERSANITRQVDKHNTYVVYAVPAGNIMFLAAPGQVYPRSAILYLN
jgi:hypothetical protein